MKYVAKDLSEHDKIARAKKADYNREYYNKYLRKTERDMEAFRCREAYRRHLAETGIMDRSLLIAGKSQ